MYVLGWGFFPKFFFGIPEVRDSRNFRDSGIPEISGLGFSGFRDSRNSGLRIFGISGFPNFGIDFSGIPGIFGKRYCH